jgi:hypothetical protein
MLESAYYYFQKSSSAHNSPFLVIGLSNFSPFRSIFGYSHPAPSSRLAQIVNPPGLTSTFTETRSQHQNSFTPAVVGTIIYNSYFRDNKEYKDKDSIRFFVKMVGNKVKVEVKNILFRLGMFTYSYESQDIIQLAVKRLRAVKETLFDLSPLFLCCKWGLPVSCGVRDKIKEYHLSLSSVDVVNGD